jgi:hypothetical protein
MVGLKQVLPGYKSCSIYGDGTYFARDSKYSDEGPYACTLASGKKQMLVAEVRRKKAA